MKFKKLLVGLLSVIALSFSTFTAFATSGQDVKIISNIEQIREAMPISEELPLEGEFSFGSFTGKVKEINDYAPIEGSKIISLEDADGMPANFIVSKDTYIVNQAEITVGSIITGYYNANAPMILIYPPQYNIEVLVVENKDYNVKVDVFDNSLVSSDNMLQLNIGEDTEIALTDGTPFEGELADRKLVVIYDISTKSIPAQTTPIKIIVLAKEVESPIADVANMDIIVNHKKINAPVAYTNANGVAMVPLRAVVQALGVDVQWDNKTQSIVIDKGIYLTVGEDNYIDTKTTPIQLGTAPKLVDGVTFVPLCFFEEVMKVDRADITESEIVINYTN